MKFSEKIRILLHVRWKPLKYSTHFLAYKPIGIFIAKSADVKIETSLSVNVSWGGYKHSPRGFLTVGNNARLICKDMAIHSGCKISVKDGAELDLGSGYINDNCEIQCKQKIIIGEGVAIAKDVIIRDFDAHTIEGSDSIAPISIGNHVWIGTGAMILKGVTIGNGAVIGARAVVTHDVPANTLVAGVPAIVKKENVVWH